ncbi:MAG TPA: DUF2298 domain-containing protein [Ktedonobacterales bacterium]|nr:DUF2298 domain-containing protein [Ktedonobacterales bacterium]
MRGTARNIAALAGALHGHALPMAAPPRSPATLPDAPVQPFRVAALAPFAARLRGWLARQDATLWALGLIALLALVPRLYGLNWDANNHLHPDERAIVFKAMCLAFPGTPRPAGCDPAYTGPGWFFSPASPLNPHFFAYGTLPQYLLAGVAHLLAWLTTLTHGRFAPAGGGAWDDFDHFTLIGRVLSALFDAGSVLLAGLLARRLAGRWAGLLAAAFVATTAFEVQVAHFYAVDTLLLFFVLLTLLGCVALAQGPREAAPAGTGADADVEDARWHRRAAGYGNAWRWGLLTGLGCGLAFAVKVSAAPLLAPVAVALALRIRRRGLDEAALALLAVAAMGIFAFLVTSPYALIDWPSFRQQVTEQTMLSQGTLDYPYVRQFAGTTPFVYQISQMLRYDMGWPLGLLGLAGFGWAAAQLWRRLNTDWAIVVVWLVAYFAVIGGAYMKFTRYMLPVFAPLTVCGAAALVALAAWGTRRLGEFTRTTQRADREGRGENAAGALHSRVPVGKLPLIVRAVRDPLGSDAAARLTRRFGADWWRWACAGLGGVVLASSLVLTLALVNIYTTPNTRVQASEWIYNHLTPGATLTSEVWDDPLPILVPPARTDRAGTGYTAAGHPILPGAYPTVGLDLYADDTPDKAQQLATDLAGVQVVVISSQRLLRSIPKLPDRYPMTTRYYELLFSGKLGFHLAAHFDNHPHLLGWTLDDTSADESYSVYDHPPVWIFVKSGAGLNQQQLYAALTSGLTLPAVANRSGAQKSLLLSPANAAADAQSPSFGAQFPADSLPNRVPLLWWLVVVELLGLVSFPLAFSVFPGLRDRGWGFAKLLGLLALAWAVWLPASVRLLPFDGSVVTVAFALLAGAGGVVGWWRRRTLWAFVRARWRLLVAGEVAFLVAFLFFTWIRALDPDLWHIWRGGEKPMELAYLDAILRSRYMPPYDPWFSGGYINYYYYGQFLVAVLIKLTGIAPTTAFNLAIPLLFALTVSGAFSVVAGVTGRWWAGLAGAFGLAMVGNLDGLFQAIGQWRALLAHLPSPPFDYWASSRVIPYTINEFPYWSFLYADLHAHLIDLPIVVLLVGCVASLVSGARRDGGRWRRIVPTLAAAALALGASWCTNTWDLPTYALLVVVALALWAFPAGRGATGEGEGVRTTVLQRIIRTVRWPAVRGFAVGAFAVLGGSYLLYAPFHANFQSAVSSTGPVTTPTSPMLFATIFGLWLFLIASYFFVELRDRQEAIWAQSAAPPGTATSRLWLLAGTYCLVLALAFLVSVKSLLLLLLGLGLYLALNPRHRPVKLLTYLTLLVGLAIALGVELIYVRDFLDGSDWERMNTVFKFYYQVWTLFALGGGLAFAQLASRVFGRSTSAGERTGLGVHRTPLQRVSGAEGARAAGVGVLRSVWIVALTALVLGCSVFLVEGTQARLADPALWARVQPPPGGLQPAGLSLDGMAYMRGWYPGDYAAITWMNAHIAGDPTIVEASSGVYNWQGRVSVYTGLPAVVQEQHEYEQRYPQEVSARQAAIVAFWSTPDPSAALAFLHEYGVRYVYVGELERTCYIKQGDQCMPMDGAALAKFSALQQQGMLRVVYQNPDVTIYQVAG